MQPESFPQFAYEALMLVLLLSLPAVLVAAAVGLGIAVFQAATQINDQSIGQAVKLIAVIAVVLFTSGWAGAHIYRFADHLMTSVGLVMPNEN